MTLPGSAPLVLAHLLAPQQRPDALDQQALAERLLDIVVRAHAEAQHLVHLVVLRRQEDHRHARGLAQARQQFHAVHAWHLDVEDRQIDRLGRQAAQGLVAVGICADFEAFGFERDRHRRQNVAVVVNQRDRLRQRASPLCMLEVMHPLDARNEASIGVQKTLPHLHSGLPIWHHCGAKLGADP